MSRGHKIRTAREKQLFSEVAFSDHLLALEGRSFIPKASLSHFGSGAQLTLLNGAYIIEKT